MVESSERLVRKAESSKGEHGTRRSASLHSKRRPTETRWEDTARPLERWVGCLYPCLKAATLPYYSVDRFDSTNLSFSWSDPCCGCDCVSVYGRATNELPSFPLHIDNSAHLDDARVECSRPINTMQVAEKATSIAQWPSFSIPSPQRCVLRSWQSEHSDSSQGGHLSSEAHCRAAIYALDCIRVLFIGAWSAQRFALMHSRRYTVLL